MKGDITICGCGWLGSYLLKRLDKQYRILATTRTAQRADAIDSLGGNVLFYSLGDDANELCRQSEDATVILNIPPGRRNKTLDEFTESMCELISAFVKYNAKQIIFISTTSVYGESERVVTECSEVHPQTESAKAHVQIENHLLKRAGDAATIVRLAGLVGPDRHPAKSLAGRSLSEANRVVNLVHVDDVVAGITRIIEQPAPQKILHLCSLAHPARKPYYTHCAEKMNLTLPIFDQYNMAHQGKQIDASASWEYLGLTPRYASPFDMIN